MYIRDRVLPAELEANPGIPGAATSGLPRKMLVTYHPLEAQKTLKENEDRIARKPYSKYFSRNLYVYEDVMPAIRTPIATAQILEMRDAPRLLERGYLEAENGWCARADGSAYVASLTRFPGATGDMVRWWFWWHSAAPERYALWFPAAHMDVRTSFAAALLARPDLPDVQKWLGATHRVVEFVGPKPLAVRITFVPPARYGLSWARLREAGYEAAVCAELRHGRLPLKVGHFLHLWRRTPDGKGLELRSRYWFGSEVRLELLGCSLSVDYLGSRLGIKKRMAGESLAYEHFMHDQIEFTNLASFLPELYQDYLAKRLQED